MPGLFTCRICGADSPYELCNNCVPPSIRARRRMAIAKQQDISSTTNDGYYEHLAGKRPPPQREETPLPKED
jgi:hypothetical protein